MHLVDDELLASAASPRGIGPAKRAGIDDLRGAVRALGLKARGGIGQRIVAAVGPETVAHAGPRLAHSDGKIVFQLGGQPTPRTHPVSVAYHPDVRSPHTGQ